MTMTFVQVLSKQLSPNWFLGFSGSDICLSSKVMIPVMFSCTVNNTVMV